MVSRKILLVHPEFPTTYWSFEHALPFVGKKASLPPLGLLTVAAMLPADYEVRLADLNVSPLALEDLLWADMVFISAMIVQKRSFDEVTALCREYRKPVVAGGPYPISMFEQIEGVDHFVLDEAELTLPRFLKDLEEGRPQRVYRDPGKPDLGLTPVPRFDLIDVAAYDSMPLQYSRGCPYNCEFCDIIEMFGRVQRTKTPAQFLRELDAVLATGFRGGVFIVELAKLEEQVSASLKAPPLKTVTAAKPPPTQLSGRTRAPEDELEAAVEKEDFTAYAEAANKREFAKYMRK